jgi:hypothetical protein
LPRPQETLCICCYQGIEAKFWDVKKPPSAQLRGFFLCLGLYFLELRSLWVQGPQVLVLLPQAKNPVAKNLSHKQNSRFNICVLSEAQYLVLPNQLKSDEEIPTLTDFVVYR